MFPGRRVPIPSSAEQKQVGPNFRPDFPFERGPAGGPKCTRLGGCALPRQVPTTTRIFLAALSDADCCCLPGGGKTNVFVVEHLISSNATVMTRRKFCSVQNMAENLFSSNHDSSHIFNCQVIINDDFSFQINELIGILYSS